MKPESLSIEQQDMIDEIVRESIMALIKEGRLKIATDEYNERLQLEMDGEAPDYRYIDRATVRLHDIVEKGAVEPSDKQSWVGW